MRVALCTRNRRNPVIRLLERDLGSRGEEVSIITDPRAVVRPTGFPSFDVAFWRPDSRNARVASFARQAAEILEGLGIPFLNSLSSSDRAGNKYASAALFAAADLQTPNTWYCPQEWDTPGTIPAGPKIVKPVGGKQGQGVSWFEELDKAVDYAISLGRHAILQEPIQWVRQVRVVSTPSRWIRAYEQAALEEQSERVVARFDRNDPRPLEAPDAELLEFARRMVRAVEGDLMRADILVDRSGGLWALEVNASFGFPHEDDVILEAFATELRAVAQRAKGALTSTT